MDVGKSGIADKVAREHVAPHALPGEYSYLAGRPNELGGHRKALKRWFQPGGSALGELALCVRVLHSVLQL